MKKALYVAIALALVAGMIEFSAPAVAAPPSNIALVTGSYNAMMFPLPQEITRRLGGLTNGVNTIPSGGVFQGSDGVGPCTANTITYGFTGVNTSGYTAVTGQPYICVNGARNVLFGSGNNIALKATTVVCWSSSSADAGAAGCDTYTQRNAAGIVGLGATTPNWLVGANIVANTNKGQHFNTQAANSDLAGTLTNVAGTSSLTFTTAWTAAPSCVATDTAATPVAVQVTTSTTTLTLTVPGGTNTDTFKYICLGNPN